MYSISYVDDLPYEIYQQKIIDINRHGQLDPVLIHKNNQLMYKSVTRDFPRKNINSINYTC